MIESRTIVLPRDARGEFHKLRLRELFPQASKEGIGNLNRRARHRVGIFENQPLNVREMKIRLVVVQPSNLLAGDTVLSADGRADVNSKWTTDQRRDAKFSQPFQLGVDQLTSYLRTFHRKYPQKISE
jgi:hypothetical protein